MEKYLTSLTDLARIRIEITTGCRDCADIPKVSNAGEIVEAGDIRYQMMHNGVKVVAGGYHGDWMSEVISRLQGHHEPQEEKAFYEVLRHIPNNGVMVEIGAFWSYYSLWFHHAVPNAKNYMVEPSPINMQVGQKNFELNGASGTFIEGAIGRTFTTLPDFICEGETTPRPIQQWTVDKLVEEHNLSQIDILHADVQGVELDMLYGASQSIERGIIRFIFLSTHHHAITGNSLIHHQCIEFLKAHNAHILASHTVGESFSGDGLIVAAMRPEDHHLPPIELSYNRYSNNIFRELEYDVAELSDEVQRLKSEQAGLHQKITELTDAQSRLSETNTALSAQVSHYEAYYRKSLIEKLLHRVKSRLVRTSL